MTYKIFVYRNDALVTECNADTRADLAEILDMLYRAYPRTAGYDYTVTAEQTTRYTLVDSEVLPDGTATADKLYAFVARHQSHNSSR